MAKIWFENDIEVALTGVSKVCLEPDYKDTTNYNKWRRIPSLDTLVYGMKLPRY